MKLAIFETRLQKGESMLNKIKKELKKANISDDVLADEMKISKRKLERKMKGEESFTKLDICNLAKCIVIHENKTRYYDLINKLFS